MSGNGHKPRLLTAADILGAADLAEETVEVPEWGGAVRVRALDVARRLALSDYLYTYDAATGRTDPRPDRWRDCAYVALGVVGEDGEPLFSITDADALYARNPNALERVASAVRRLSFPEESRPLAPSGASPTGSPSASE